MASPKKIPYYEIDSSFFSKKWKGYFGDDGCVPLITQKTVSMDRLAPGEAPPPKPPKPTYEQVKAQKTEEERRKLLVQLAKQQDKDKSKEKAPESIGEECENPPVFDMLDIPDAMDKMKWPVSAKIARRWFSSPKHIYNDDMNSVQPMDDTIVTLDWALKFGVVKDRFDQLLSKDIYNAGCMKFLRNKISRYIETQSLKSSSPPKGFNTTSSLNDLQQFHNDWQFQFANVTNRDTMDNFTLTDLTGALANFNIYVAIGNVVMYGDKYFKYDNLKGT